MKNLYLILTVTLAVLILFFSVIPEIEKSTGISEKKVKINSGKILHLLAYFLLSFLIYKTTNNIKTAVLFAGTYGLLIEFTQLFIPYRNFEIFDILINYVGSSIAFFFRKIRF